MFFEIDSILVIDDQQSGTNTKQGLTPSPSNAFSPANTNPVDSTNGMKFLMVPGQSAQMGSFSSGKHTFDVHDVFIYI